MAAAKAALCSAGHVLADVGPSLLTACRGLRRGLRGLLPGAKMRHVAVKVALHGSIGAGGYILLRNSPQLQNQPQHQEHATWRQVVEGLEEDIAHVLQLLLQHPHPLPVAHWHAWYQGLRLRRIRACMRTNEPGLIASAQQEIAALQQEGYLPAAAQ